LTARMRVDESGWQQVLEVPEELRGEIKI
jgi:hypothetical protein